MSQEELKQIFNTFKTYYRLNKQYPTTIEELGDTVHIILSLDDNLKVNDLIKITATQFKLALNIFSKIVKQIMSASIEDYNKGYQKAIDWLKFDIQKVSKTSIIKNNQIFKIAEKYPEFLRRENRIIISIIYRYDNEDWYRADEIAIATQSFSELHAVNNSLLHRILSPLVTENVSFEIRLYSKFATNISNKPIHFTVKDARGGITPIYRIRHIITMLTNILGKIDRDSSPATLSNIINDDMIKALLEEYKRNSESVERFLTMLTEIGQTLGIVEFDLLERFLILKI